ncbi:MAG: PAS domain S-box protein [Deltaproteobacteria bacterium]|nr:PAS domain S-box protein [Deltaproteobacteria bacterium]
MTKKEDHHLDEKEIPSENPSRDHGFRDSVHHFACDWDGWIGPDNRHRYVSPGCRNITGYGPEEFMNRPELLGEIVHEADRQGFLSHMKKDPGKEKAFQNELRIVRKDGEVRWIQHICEPVYGPDGEPLGRRYSNRDISAFKFSETALMESEADYRNIVESSNEGICILHDDRICFVNRRLADMVGLGPKEMVGTSFFEHLDSRELLRVKGFYEGFVADKERRQRFETVLRAKKGRCINVEATIIPTFHANQQAALIIIRDITEFKHMEREKRELERILQHSQRMEAIGTLAGGIAHEFNNILWIISANTEYALEFKREGGDVSKNLKRIETACERASDLVRQILNFSRQRQQDPRPLDVRAVVKETLKFMRASLPKSIKIHTAIGKNVGQVIADPAQMHQVVTNLCTNAFHAMRETGGTLKVSLRNIDEKERVAFPVGMAPGRYVRLRVQDTGAGMPAEVMNRVFEPFFTTKQPGEGTGLGLSVVYGIVESCHGAITVNSTPGKGSVFDVFLPIAEEKSGLTFARTRPIPTGNERILFVDDEKEIAEIVRKMLERLGYSVHVETNPAGALQTFKERPGDFSLVITDMSMPCMSGEALAKNVHAVRSDIPIIICTGYGEVIDERRARMSGVSKVIIKPATIDVFAKAIRAALDKEQDKTSICK